MDLIEEFQKHANECRRMARFTRDLASKVMWNRMVERWQSLVATEKARTRQRSETGIRRAQAVHRRVDSRTRPRGVSTRHFAVRPVRDPRMVTRRETSVPLPATPAPTQKEDGR
jgi:hypothetical protein